MKLWERITKAVASTASKAASDTFRSELKQMAIDAIPIIVEIGIFCSVVFARDKHGADDKISLPEHTHIIINNYYGDEFRHD